jgi:hypothetical protein
MLLTPNTLEIMILGYKGLTQPATSTRPSSASSRCHLRDDAMCTTRSRASDSLKTRLENPSVTCFQPKQAIRTRHMSRAILPPSVLWCNRQIKACLILSPKPRNYRGDFDTQITKPQLPVLRPKPGNPRHGF